MKHREYRFIAYYKNLLSNEDLVVTTIKRTTKARFKRWTSHVPNLMQISKIYCYFLRICISTFEPAKNKFLPFFLLNWIDVLLCDLSQIRKLCTASIVTV